MSSPVPPPEPDPSKPLPASMQLPRTKWWVDDDGAKALWWYKYSGEDKSYIYKYVLTPMNEVLVKFLPIWLAPNLVTLSGLMVCVLMHYVVYLYSPKMDAVLPPWLCCYIAASLFAYQTIDNLDGKQARRTGSSSALGLLFDHGVDALNVTVASLCMGAMFQTGYTYRSLILWSITFVPFVMATWEEYYVGKLTLPTLNGPTDGVLLCCCFCFAAALQPGFWQRTWGQTMGPFLPFILNTPLEHLLNVDGVLISAGMGVFLTVAFNTWAIYSSEWKQKRAPGLTPFIKLLPFAALYAGAWATALWSPTDIFHTNYRLFQYTVGILFAGLICKLMLAHLTHQNYRVFRSGLIPFALYVANYCAGPRAIGKVGTPLVALPFSEHTALVAVFGLGVLTWACFVVPTIWEITTALGSRVFRIKPKTN